MKPKSLNTIKTSGFKTPKNYFSQVEDQILSGIHLKNTVESSGFEVPESYFATVEHEIINKVATENDTKVISFFNWEKVMYTTAIAASLVLMFNVLFSSEAITPESIETASLVNYLEQEDYSTYELASLLTEEELSKDNFIDTRIPEDYIEDYLLNNASIEELITE